MHTCVVWFIYSHNRDDVTSLDLVVSHTPTIQQDDVTLGPPLWVEEWLNTNTTNTVYRKSLFIDVMCVQSLQ